MKECSKSSAKIIMLTFLMVTIARFKAEQCMTRYFQIVNKDFPPLPPQEFISSHVLEWPVQAYCNLLCFSVSKCVGFNFRNNPKAINCQLTHTTKQRKQTVEGEWSLFLDVDAEKAHNDAQQMAKVPKNCGEIFKSGKKQNGVYTINPDGLGNFQVWCDMKTDGGGWTVFQSRHNESVDFYRVWQDYKNGFGDVHGNFWLGLEQIYRLTNSGANVLRVELMSWTNESGYAKYKSFYVASESNFYALKLGGFSGNIGDSLAPHNGMNFSTYDRDNDRNKETNCAETYQGGWWYHGCLESNLNGRYLPAKTISASGTCWLYWKKDYRSMKKIEMKIRPAHY